MGLMAAGELGIFTERQVVWVAPGAATDLGFEWNVTKRGICTLPSRYVRQQKTRLHSITSNRAKLRTHAGHCAVACLTTATPFFQRKSTQRKAA